MGVFFLECALLVIYVFMEGTHIPGLTCVGQRTTCKTQFSLTMSFPGIKFRSSGSAALPVSHPADTSKEHRERKGKDVET